MRYPDNNIIISDSTLRNILPPQLKKITPQSNVLWSCECFIYAKIMHYFLLTWRDLHLNHLKDRSHNAQKQRSGEISSRIFETYKNAVRPYGYHIYNTTAGMAMATMWTYTSKHHGLPHCKCVLRCCDKCPIIALPSQGANKYTTNSCPTIIFHVYRNFSRCTIRERRSYNKLTTCLKCSTVPISDRTNNVYTQK